jgi:hypothetical protein
MRSAVATPGSSSELVSTLTSIPSARKRSSCEAIPVSLPDTLHDRISFVVAGGLGGLIVGLHDGIEQTRITRELDQDGLRGSEFRVMDQDLDAAVVRAISEPGAHTFRLEGGDQIWRVLLDHHDQDQPRRPPFLLLEEIARRVLACVRLATRERDDPGLGLRVRIAFRLVVGHQRTSPRPCIGGTPFRANSTH